MKLRSLLLLLLLALVSACGANQPSALNPRRDPNVLSREELQSADARNALEAVEKLRPRWLQKRAVRTGLDIQENVEIGVYFDNIYRGDPTVLRQIPVSDIGSMRYLDPVTAQQRFGSSLRTVYGAIMVSTGDGRRLTPRPGTR